MEDFLANVVIDDAIRVSRFVGVMFKWLFRPSFTQKCREAREVALLFVSDGFFSYFTFVIVTWRFTCRRLWYRKTTLNFFSQLHALFDATNSLFKRALHVKLINMCRWEP